MVIALQTRAELLSGSLQGDWGPARLSTLHDLLDGTVTLAPNLRVAQSYAELTAAAAGTGHALANKIQTGDRWIAATAIAFDLPLLTGDAICLGAPDIRLLGSTDEAGS